MICPRCQSDLLETSKHGVVIDHCPGCGGIWLDKGEMAKIINQMRQIESSLDEEFRATAPERREYRPPRPQPQYQGPSHPEPYPPQPPQYQPRPQQQGQYQQEQHYQQHQGKHRHPKRKSMFENLFDIFD